MRVSIIMTCIFLIALSSCSKAVNDGGEYGGKVLSWLSKGSNKDLILKSKPDNFYLYYNDAATCETCKLKLFEMLKERKDLVILTSFENETEVSFFKEAYKIENKVINSPEFRNNFLIYPFLFQTNIGSSFYNIYVFNDENQNEITLNDYFEYIEDSRVVFF
jgi:hypothetical protein